MKPRLKSFINVVRDGSDTCYLMASEKDLFRCQGKSVPVLIDHVLPLLDGTRTVEELIAALSGTLGEQAVRGVLDLLQRHHVLASGAGEAEPGPAEADPAAFHGVLTLLSRYSDQPDRLLQRLRQARVVVIGDSPWVQDMVQALVPCAVGAIDVVTDGPAADGLAGTGGPVPVRRLGLDRMAEALPGAGLTIALQDGEFCFMDRLRELNRLCLQLGASWLHVRLTLESEGWVGPLYVPGGACFECLDRRLKSNLKNWKENGLHERHIEQGLLAAKRMEFAPFRTQLAGQAAVEVVRCLIGLAPTNLIGRTRLVDLLTGETSLHTVLRTPRCPACGKQRTGRIYPWGSEELKIERMLLGRGTP